jgi:hypothetical protein
MSTRRSIVFRGHGHRNRLSRPTRTASTRQRFSAHRDLPRSLRLRTIQLPNNYYHKGTIKWDQ